jgi:hypothetical protein
MADTTSFRDIGWILLSKTKSWAPPVVVVEQPDNQATTPTAITTTTKQFQTRW